jgi:hypothetical protein
MGDWMAGAEEKNWGEKWSAYNNEGTWRSPPFLTIIA